MKVCAVVVNYRTAEKTLESLAHLLADLACIDAHVVVVDNDSRDGSEDQIRQAASAQGWTDRVTVLQAGVNGGFGAGNNAGIRWALSAGAPPDYFLLINPDAYPEPGTCRSLTDFLDRNPQAGILGTAIRGIDGNLRRSAFRFPSAPSEFESNIRLGLVSRLLRPWVVAPPIPAGNQSTDWVSGSCMMIRRELLSEIGLFDETFFLYFEEVDLCRRARAAGWNIVWIKDATIVHDAGFATGIQNISRPRPKYWFDSRRYYFRKNHGRIYLWLANLAWLAGNIGWQLRCRFRHTAPGTPPRLIRDFCRYSF